MAKLNVRFSKKKVLLLGFLFAILLVIPLTVYLVQQQQGTQSHATPNTNLSFVPETATTQVGGKVTFNIQLSPGNNQVNFVKLVLKFDSTKLSATNSSFTVDPASNLSILQGPVVVTDTISVALNTGSDPTRVIQADTKIGTVTFDVIGASTVPTQVTFDSATQISSINGANNDAFNENVFQNGTPATITIQGGVAEIATPTAILTQAPTSPTPIITQGVNQQSGENSNQAPVCSALGIDGSASGVAPYTVNFTASGTDTDGTISKVNFNFGDGNVQEVSSGSGITTDSADVTLEHIYDNADTYTATAVMTDNQGGTSSDSVNCSKEITVTNDGTSTTSTNDTTDTTNTTDQTASDSANVSPLPATGPSHTIFGFGALGGILFLIGTLLFLAL